MVPRGTYEKFASVKISAIGDDCWSLSRKDLKTRGSWGEARDSRKSLVARKRVDRLAW